MGINLSKGQSLSLAKPSGPQLTKVFMGLGWDVAKPSGFFARLSAPDSIDLDASCVLIDGQNNIVDIVWFRQLASKDGSIRHSGDNLTGAGDGDDEVIHVDLSRVPPNVQVLAFTVNSFRGQNFSIVANAKCRLVDGTTNQELAVYNLAATGEHTGMAMSVLRRDGGSWTLKALGIPGTGRTVQELIPLVLQNL
jgi:tellurium resistance protein TerZ